MKPEELIIDSFAGGGGASLGIQWALGRGPDIAINHDAAAIAMHEANHPETQHFTEDVWKVNPRLVTRGRPVGLLWASPDCKHFSRAKGGKPVEKKIRSLAWVVVKWAKEAKPKVIMLENVREFADWGPLVPMWLCRSCGWRGTQGQAKLARRRLACASCDAPGLRESEELVPDPARKGLTFKRFVGRLRSAGYEVAWRVLDAADYGAPTHRKRLFLIARRDGERIVWPEPTHGDPKKIGRGLFDRHLKPWRTAAECIDWSLPCPSIFERERPLAEATMRRIAFGVKRYVLDATQPFIVGVGGRMGQSPAAPTDSPHNTVTSKNDRAIVTPYLVRCNHGGKDTWGRGREVTDPMFAATGSHGDALVAPVLIQAGYGERDGQAPRVLDLGNPMGTAVAGGNKQALVAAYLAKHFGGVVGVPTDSPLPTTTARGTQNQLVTANLIHLNHGGKQDSGCDEPMRTATAGGLHAALVYSFLVKYFGTAVGQGIEAPLGTATTKDRFGVVTVTIDGEPYVIVDIGMRMLMPRELARGQGFPDDYILTGTKTSQVARIGNSVCPVMAEAMVRANFGAARGEQAA